MNSNNQVKQLRLQRARSREQLAEMAGLSVRTIQRIENGERPGLETLSALAAVFEVTVAEIGGEARREDAPGREASLDLRIEEAKARVHQESRFFRSLSVALVVCVLLAVLNRFTNPQYYWSGWVALIWGALLVVRGLRLFVFGEWIKTGAGRACSGCCANRPQTGGATAAGMVRWSPSRARRRSPYHHPCLAGRWRRATSPVVVRQSGGKVIELLHQQDRHVSAARQLADHLANLFDDRGLDPSVGSSGISSCGRLASARPIASCCCWPPDKSPPRRCFMVLSTGKSW